MSTIELKADALYNKEMVDLEGGWSCLGLEQEEQNPLLQFLSFMWNPLSWGMEATALIAIALSNIPVVHVEFALIALSNGEGLAPDWQGFVDIVLLFINSVIGFYEERGAGNAVKVLIDSFAPKARIKPSVPGDMVSFKIDDVVPADCRLTEAINVSIDQAVLTGSHSRRARSWATNVSRAPPASRERLRAWPSPPVPTRSSGSASLVGQDDDTTGHLQKTRADPFLLPGRHRSRRHVIGGIPIAMPTVPSVTLAVGAQQLAKHKAVVTPITAIEELGGL
ncbi:Plasma membrane ATPase [Mycena venus]|uniref:Plasma membrane ATPase n=1 Tax=Mycena venus TaxID=2733690 RepID=A0A8H6WTV6_9AGAR|nr:Plasma membrane ATPase [Mycena venus]